MAEAAFERSLKGLDVVARARMGPLALWRFGYVGAHFLAGAALWTCECWISWQSPTNVLTLTLTRSHSYSLLSLSLTPSFTDSQSQSPRSLSFTLSLISLTLVLSRFYTGWTHSSLARSLARSLTHSLTHSHTRTHTHDT